VTFLSCADRRQEVHNRVPVSARGVVADAAVL